MRISDWSSDVCSSDLRQDGNGHDDDADAAEPLQDGAPQQDAGGRDVQSDDHRDAGGGDARHRLEEGVDRNELTLRKLERSDERLGGHVWFSTCIARWSPYNSIHDEHARQTYTNKH